MCEGLVVSWAEETAVRAAGGDGIEKKSARDFSQD